MAVKTWTSYGHLIEAKKRTYYNPEKTWRILLDGRIIIRVKNLEEAQKAVTKLRYGIARMQPVPKWV